MKLKVYNKKVIDFVWENMMTSFFVADNAPKKKNSVIIFSHTKSITYNYHGYLMYKYYNQEKFCKIVKWSFNIDSERSGGPWY
jgi:hypothetical protein